MVRLVDLPEWEREHLLDLGRRAPTFSTRPWVRARALRHCRVTLISTAGLHRRGDRPFGVGAGATQYRIIASDTPAHDLVMSHVSVNFDRTGYRQDVNVVLPVDRLRELAEIGVIGSVADFHYSFMGAPFPPTKFENTARQLAQLLKRELVDAAVLCPV